MNKNEIVKGVCEHCHMEYTMNSNNPLVLQNFETGKIEVICQCGEVSTHNTTFTPEVFNFGA